MKPRKLGNEKPHSIVALTGSPPGLEGGNSNVADVAVSIRASL